MSRPCPKCKAKVEEVHIYGVRSDFGRCSGCGAAVMLAAPVLMTPDTVVAPTNGDRIRWEVERRLNGYVDPKDDQ